MKPSTLIAAFAAFFVGAAFTFAAVRLLEVGDPEMALVIGAVLGVNVGAVVHHWGGVARTLPSFAKLARKKWVPTWVAAGATPRLRAGSSLLCGSLIR